MSGVSSNSVSAIGLRGAVIGEGKSIRGVEFAVANSVYDVAVSALMKLDPRVVAVGIVKHPLGGYAFRASRDLQRYQIHSPEICTVENVPVLFQNQYEFAKPLTSLGGGASPSDYRFDYPLTSGHDIRNEKSGHDDFGTISFIVADNYGQAPISYLFSNNHVLIGQNRSPRKGEAILHPFNSVTSVAVLHRFVRLERELTKDKGRPSRTNKADIGVAILHSKVPFSETVKFSRDVLPLRPGDSVDVVVGSNGPDAKAVVAEVGQQVPVHYIRKSKTGKRSSERRHWFSDVIRLELEASPGTSGSAIVRVTPEGVRELVGIVFAGAGQFTYGFPVSSLIYHWDELTAPGA